MDLEHQRNAKASGICMKSFPQMGSCSWDMNFVVITGDGFIPSSIITLKNCLMSSFVKSSHPQAKECPHFPALAILAFMFVYTVQFETKNYVHLLPFTLTSLINSRLSQGVKGSRAFTESAGWLVAFNVYVSKNHWFGPP